MGMKLAFAQINLVRVLRILVVVTVSTIISPPANSQRETATITITEPANLDVADLFRKADTVALVKITSGDAETYDVAVYKATILESFKGAARHDTIYFGPFIGEKLGWEYIVFLRSTDAPMAPQKASGGYGTVHYSEILNQGYGSMMTSYECVFDGKEIQQHCDQAVRICTDYIVLPKSFPTFPS